MGKYVLAAVFLLMMALNVGAYLVFIRGIDGSTVVTKRSLTHPEQPGRARPAR